MNESSSLISDVNLDQIGIVVHNLHAFTEEISRLFGIGPFRIIEWPVEGINPQSTYHGQLGDFRLLLAFITLGNIQIEIIQPLEGQNIFSDFLRDHGPGLHHIRMTIPEFEQGVKALIGEGIKNIASGTGVHVGSNWAYFDTTKELEGVMVELRTRLEGTSGEGKWASEVDALGE